MFDYSCDHWAGLCDHLRDVSWEDFSELSASVAASEFCKWVQVRIDVYICHHKYLVKPLSSTWFSATYAAPIVHGNYFFHMYQQSKSSDSKGDLRQVSNYWKSVFEAAKRAYATKTKESITSQKFGSVNC